MPDGNGPLTPEEAAAAMIADMANVLLGMLGVLVERGTMSREEAIQLLTLHLHPDPESLFAKVRQTLLSTVLLGLAGRVQ